MLAEVFAESILVQVRLETEYFLGNLLVLSLNPFQLSLSLIEMQALRFELNVGHRVTFAKAGSW